DPALTAGHDTACLQGRYAIDQGLRQLLSGTGLMAVSAPAGGYLLRRMPVAQGDASVLEPVMVVGSHEVTTEGTGAYTSGATSIAKGAQSLKDIPQSISVVTRQRLDEQSLTSIYDALANTTGITLQQSPQAGKYVYSRGFRNTSYQYDGIPLDRSMYGRASNFGGGTAIYDRVEVLRGATGLLQGAGKPSASVNLVRKRPQPRIRLQRRAQRRQLGQLSRRSRPGRAAER
ncbi:TonB-dependent siderophore receptor, partial [Piscirickettsia salmonis]|uniref:TonB-dependent siderophore receptor n=1 Tax=Piscirickettsia salmonis TaxID=1238 RepID=UPI000BFB05C7